MRRADITDDFVIKVAEGIREFNRSSPPSELRFENGVQVPLTEQEQLSANTGWYSAVRHGLYKAAES